MSGIELIHPSGLVALREVEARIVGDQLHVRGIIDSATWDRLQRDDVFGAATRPRSPGVLPPGDDLRITIATDAELPSDVTAVPAAAFVIVDAMRAVTPDDVAAAGLEGEVWDGIRFEDRQSWSRAVAQLVADGFEVVSVDERATVLVHDGDIAMVRFQHRPDVGLVQIVASSPLPLVGDVPQALYEAVNGINLAVPWSTTMLDGVDVLVRDTVSDHTADQSGAIDAMAQNLLGLLWIMRSPLADAAQGTKAAQQVLEAMFGS